MVGAGGGEGGEPWGCRMECPQVSEIKHPSSLYVKIEFSSPDQWAERQVPSGEPWPVLQKAHSVTKGWPGKVSIQVKETSNNVIK